MKANLTNLKWAIALLLFATSCSKPYEPILDKTWFGQIYRASDEKELSPVVVKMVRDTMFLYSNAIFGSNNDTLLLSSYADKDSIFTFSSISGKQYKLKFGYPDKENQASIYLIGEDYFMYLVQDERTIQAPGIPGFYLNREVPREAYLYLDGTYEGQLQMENQMSDLLLAGLGGVSLKLEFLDDFKLKIIYKSLAADLFSGSSKPNAQFYDYDIVGDEIITKKENAKVHSIRVKNFGETLVIQDDELNVVMYKQY